MSVVAVVFDGVDPARVEVLSFIELTACVLSSVLWDGSVYASVAEVDSKCVDEMAMLGGLISCAYTLEAKMAGIKHAMRLHNRFMLNSFDLGAGILMF